jgi:hypothetical protein
MCHSQCEPSRSSVYIQNAHDTVSLNMDFARAFRDAHYCPTSDPVEQVAQFARLIGIAERKQRTVTRYSEATGEPAAWSDWTDSPSSLYDGTLPFDVTVNQGLKGWLHANLPLDRTASARLGPYLITHHLGRRREFGPNGEQIHVDDHQYKVSLCNPEIGTSTAVEHIVDGEFRMNYPAIVAKEQGNA